MPTPTPEQGDLFPHLTPSTIERHLLRALRRLQRMRPALSPSECLQVLGEIALLELLVDRLETSHLLAARFLRAPSVAARTTTPTARWAEGPNEPAWARRSRWPSHSPSQR